MTPKEFREHWLDGDNDTYYTYLAEDLIKFELKPETVDFLSVSGLPSQAAPFLAFERKIEPLPYHYPHVDNSFNNYILIGGDGAGDPIVINISNNDQVEWLNHENDFSYSFCNTSIKHFVEFLLIFRSFIQLLKTKGSNAFLSSEYSIEEYETLKASLKNVDSRAVEEGFWKTELDMLLINKDLKKS